MPEVALELEAPLDRLPDEPLEPERVVQIYTR
jgi:hypothetical protein